MRAFRQAVCIAIATLMCAAGVATAQTFSAPGYVPKNPAAAAKIALRNEANDFFNKAQQHVNATVAGCKPSYPRAPAVPTHASPSQAVLDVLAPLRRPATPADLDIARERHTPFGGETYVDYVRTVKAANGTKLTIVIGRFIRPSYRPNARCLDATRARLIKILAGQPDALRAEALKELAQIRRDAARTPKQSTTPQDGIFLYAKGGGGGGGNVTSFLKRGNLISFGGGRTSHSTIHGLVPDGVATVTLEYPKVASNGPLYKPTVYPSAYTRTIHVQNNVFSAHVPRGAGGAFRCRIVWRDSTGNVIHVYRQR